MRTVFILTFIFFNALTYSQTVIQGSVMDSATKKPISAASIFISNTSIGVTSSSDGKFSIRIPQGKFELVVSCIGYNTKVFASSEVSVVLNVVLSQKVNELEGVVLVPFETKGWEKWGRTFVEAFIGTTDQAEDCSIQNHETIKFRFDKKKNILTAIAREPIIIENKALGYIIKYQLEEFVYNFSERFVFHEGYPLFEQMKGNERKQSRWNKARKSVYEGSQMHFMRSLYRNTLAENGFEVHRLKKMVNDERRRVRGVIHRSGMPSDSSNYFQNILAQPDQYDVMSSAKLTGDSIAYAVDSLTAGLEFPDHLQITYTKKKVPLAYTRQFPKNGSAMTSQVKLLSDEPLLISSNGSYHSPRNLLNLGFWSWSEKVSTMLPFDYVPD